MGGREARLAGRTCLVTGATSGLGQETAIGLARLGAHVILVGRSASRGERARAEVGARSGNPRVDLLLADLSVQAEVRRLAAEVLERAPRLDVLVNNAGVMNLSRTLTADGLEATFAVNHLAYFLLSNLLLPRLAASAPARIVNVASDAHRFGKLDLGDLQSERAYGGLPVVGAMRVYAMTKLANLLFTDELARRTRGSGVTVNAVHPGFVASRLGSNNGAVARAVIFLLRPFALSPAQGAETSIHVASAPELEGVTGRYFARSREAEPSGAARDRTLAGKLWDASARLTGLAS
jgi:NAD(P)-dependent dehydrogenase (short-subunit alcohol dehydrogenase family)